MPQGWEELVLQGLEHGRVKRTDSQRLPRDEQQDRGFNPRTVTPCTRLAPGVVVVPRGTEAEIYKWWTDCSVPELRAVIAKKRAQITVDVARCDMEEAQVMWVEAQRIVKGLPINTPARQIIS